MNRPAGHDAASFGVVLFVALGCCAWVTGSLGVFWIMFAIVPVFIFANGLDRK